MSKVGGFDIAAMTGFYLGCALHRVPAIMDGFISTAAALAAGSRRGGPARRRCRWGALW